MTAAPTFSGDSPDTPCIWFRVDEYPTIGSGHFTRCLALAVQLQRRGAEVVFAFCELSEASREKLADLGIRQVALPSWQEPDDSSQDALALQAHLEQAPPSQQLPLLVVDVYRLDASWHRQLRALVSIICIIDDLSNRPYECDILVDPTLGKSPAAYRPWVPAACELCLGPNYALLREQFLRDRGGKPGVREERASEGTSSAIPIQVMVTMGGADERNATEKVLRALRKLPTANRLNVTVVLGALNPHVQSVGRMLAGADFLTHRLLRNVSNMAERMSAMDFCVSAAGSTLWECCALGLPTVAIATADNQSEVLATLHRAQAVVSLGELDSFSRAELSQVLGELLGDASQRQRLAHCARSLCDGRGSLRISARLMEMYAARASLVS